MSYNYYDQHHMIPEESYSRQLDRDVAAQEFPYGKPYPMDYAQVEKGAKRGILNNVSKVKRSKA